MNPEADKAEYEATVSPDLDACFKDIFYPIQSHPSWQLRLNSHGGLMLIRHLAKHGFKIVKA